MSCENRCSSTYKALMSLKQAVPVIGITCLGEPVAQDERIVEQSKRAKLIYANGIEGGREVMVWIKCEQNGFCSKGQLIKPDPEQKEL